MIDINNIYIDIDVNYYIEEIKKDLANKQFISALAIALMLPNICAKLENPEIDKIHKEISKCRTLFDENLNYRIDKILNNSSEEDIENKKFIQMCISKIEEKQRRKLNAEEIRLIKTVAPIMKLTAKEDEN